VPPTRRWTRMSFWSRRSRSTGCAVSTEAAGGAVYVRTLAALADSRMISERTVA
jgi:hypothetical protein